MKKIFFFLAALMLTFTAQATIVECNPGTNNLAWYLTQGDTLVLADGIYEEAYSIDFNKLGVCVKAAEGAKPVIKLTGEYTVLDVQATTTFEGITFDAGNVAKYLVATTGVNPGTLTINNCEFRNWTYWALSNQFEETASIDSVIVNNTIFHDGAEAAISFNNKAPEGLHSCNYFSLTNSTIYNVKSTEYAGIVHVSSNGEATGKQNTIIIDHVTMYNLDGADLGIIAVRKSSDLTISNTIIANPAEGERASYVYGGVAENVIYYNVSQDGDLTYTNCLTDDPKFVDAANGNFALAEGSPALTAGTDGKAIGDPRWNVVAEPEPTTETVYFINTKKWAAVKAHVWGGKAAESAWPGKATVKETEKVAGYDVYSFTANVGDYANIIFNNNNGGSQTADLVWTAGKYYVIDMGWLTKEEAETKLAAPLPETWNIVGDAGLMGKGWDLNAAENAMTQQADGTYLLEKKDITITAGTYEYKAAKDHGWTVAVPQDGNQKLTISKSGIYDITFVLNVTAKTLKATATLKKEAVVIPDVIIAGDMNSWNQTKDKFTMAADSLTATFKTTLAVKNYGFKMIVGGAWLSDGKTITRAANSTKFTGANSSTNSTLKADIAGEYLFTWEYATKTLTVTYPELPVEYTVTATVNPAETGTVAGAGKYEEGKTATLTATPAEGYQFVNWTVGEEVVSTENPYSFVVTADVALVANFELIPPTKYNVTVTAENGTVEGAGKYEEGKTATLTATPAEGYQFVNWTKGEEVVSTENPYTFTVTADVALVANFELIPVVEPEKPEPTYTENNLNPFAFGLESVLSADKSTLTVTYRLNNSNATSVNVIVYNGDEVVATVPGTATIGKNTVEVPTADLPGGVELTWSVEVNGTSVKAPTQETKIYSIYHPSSVDIDNNPENPTFGMLLVNEAMQSVKTTTKETPYISKGFGAGIFAFTPSFDLMPNGELPGYNGGKTFSTATNMFAPRRIRFSKDGRIFATAQDGSGEYLWEINPENLNEWTTVFQGTNDGYTLKDAEGNFIAGTNSGFDVRGEGENLQLLMLSASLPGAQVGSFKCHTYDLGTATTWATAPTKEIPGANYMLVTNQSNVQFDKDGGVWYISYRGTTTEKEPGLVHINKDGVEDYKELRNMTRNAGFRFNHDFTKVIIAGNNGASKKATIYAMSEDANGAPVLTQETVIDMSAVGANLNDFAWDYAGNLYACGNSSEKLAAWAMPYSGEVETPAASKYAFQLEGQLAETWDVTMTNLQVDDYGESIGLSADDKNTGLNVWLAIDTNGVIIPDYSSAAIVQGWSEIELPIVAGNLTKTYVDSLDTDVYSGLVIAEYEGGYLGLNLTMYYVPVPPVVVIVENATVDDQTENTGIMYMRGQWTDAESVVYPVTVEVPGFDATLAETVYDNVTVTVGGMEDEPWLGFGQGSATVTIANNLVTLKSVVSDWGGTVIDITISGNLSQGPGTALDNVDVEAKTIKMLKNGQLIIIKNGVQYNVQGQVIK